MKPNFGSAKIGYRLINGYFKTLNPDNVSFYGLAPDALMAEIEDQHGFAFTVIAGKDHDGNFSIKASVDKLNWFVLDLITDEWK